MEILFVIVMLVWAYYIIRPIGPNVVKVTPTMFIPWLAVFVLGISVYVAGPHVTTNNTTNVMATTTPDNTNSPVPADNSVGSN